MVKIEYRRPNGSTPPDDGRIYLVDHHILKFRVTIPNIEIHAKGVPTLQQIREALSFDNCEVCSVLASKQLEGIVYHTVTRSPQPISTDCIWSKIPWWCSVEMTQHLAVVA